MKPGPSLIIAALLWLLFAAAAYFFPILFIFWLYAGLALIPFIGADFFYLLLLCDKFEVRREVTTTLSQGRQIKVRIFINRTAQNKPVAGQQGNTKKRITDRLFVPSKIRLFDLYPASMECTAFPTVLDRCLFSENSASVCFEYEIVPRERGPWYFSGTELLLSSALRFWELKVFHKCASAGKTYPDFNRIKAGADLRGLLDKTGVKNIRRRGQGMEFRDLRDYQQGDSIRDIDWRAASRRRGMDGFVKLAVREYQDEQDQQLLFLLDTGFRLHRRESAGSRTQFDSALEAALLLSWVSLKHGDSVAAACFGSTTRWLFPGKGMRAFPKLMNGLYDLNSSPAPSSPFSCLEQALERLKRRTFIILISNFREEDGESLSWIIKRIERRHLLLMVSLKEKESEMLASRQPANFEQALETAAAFSYLKSRRELYQKWEHQGLLTLEASAENLSPALINRYLEVKRSGLL